MKRRIVVATANSDKLAEIRSILKGLGVELVPVREIVDDWHVEETGGTLRENALIKARAARDATGLPAVGDDTGLSVDALGGAPGIYAARYAGSDCSYSDNVRKLLRALAGEAGPGRRAAFVTAAALVMPDGREVCVHGEVRGHITDSPQGDGGFGYDPVFYSLELGKTFAESAPEEKNRISHRRRALAALRQELRRMEMAATGS